MKAILYPLGTRVRVRRGPFPIDGSLVGRTGVVVAISDYRPELYGVVLDGETGRREFSEFELEPEGGELPDSRTRGELL